MIGLERKIDSGVLFEAETAKVFDGRRKLDTIDQRTYMSVSLCSRPKSRLAAFSC